MQPFPELDKTLNEIRARDLTGSLEQCKEQLRDAYMNFKDLQSRCVMDIKPKKDFISGEHAVYYFKPETFLLDDAEKQRHFRESMLKKIGDLPKPEGITYLGDELHRSMCQTIADQSSPQLTKKMLAQYFKRRQYMLQHQKYKLLCRWAHHTLTSDSMEKFGPDATLLYGKLQFNLEQSMMRHDRLNQNDYFDSLKNNERPSTRADISGGALYVENNNISQQSLIREDDLEVYTRGVTYRNKINRVMNKFMSRLKWLPMKEKYQIYEKAVEKYFRVKDQNIKRQLAQYELIKERAKNSNILTLEQENELQEILQGYYCHNYPQQFVSQIDRMYHGWKANHDEVPKLIADNQLLKVKILERAKVFDIICDIELDQGFTISYQVQVFFPTYFQRQIIKSQFSLYDAFGEDLDQNDAQKVTLSNMAHIDTNIFRDVSTQKASVPNDDSIKLEFRNQMIKVIRLKSAGSWVDYIALTPEEPDWHVKQQAIINCDNPIDTLLQNAISLLDIQDLATVNRILEDSTHLHRETLKKLKKHNPHDLMQKVNYATPDGSKSMQIDMIPLNNSIDEAANIQRHLLSAVTGQNADQDSKQQQKTHLIGPSLKNLPSHLLAAYFTLRFIQSRDAKTRILYTLNYFRSVQKRIAIDLREFATRDRIDGAQANPFIPSQESSSALVNQINLLVKQDNLRSQSDEFDSGKIPKQKLTVFDNDAIKSIKDMASLRSYKNNGMFSNRVFLTCPSYPKFHSAYGEPIVQQSFQEEQDYQTNNSVPENAIKLMNRVDFIEINEQLQEVYVKDDFGIYILYDCVLQDMQSIEHELCKLGSYFINKFEVLVDPVDRPLPARDRQELLCDLLLKEAEFQFNKVKLCQVYMECYEHISDPLEQQRIMQIITDLMARRPRLNLDANYFVDAYDSEITCLQKQFELAKQLVDLQISLEKTENKRVQESMNLSYQLATQYSQEKWKYMDSESLLIEFVKKHMEKSKEEQQKDKVNREYERDVANATQKKNRSSNQLTSENKDHVHSQSGDNSYDFNDGLSSEELSLDEGDAFKENTNKFAQLLGLPQITIETIYQSYRENDKTVIQLMKEHSNFVAINEGYPEYLLINQKIAPSQKNKSFKANYWSQDTGALDFYETLDFINKFVSVTKQMQEELYESLKPWNNVVRTQIDIQVVEFTLAELHNVLRYQDGTDVEYVGRDLVENETIMGNSDNLIFYAKEIVSDLTHKPKYLLDPFVIAKLDISSIFYFNFPKLTTDMNKYTQRMHGVTGAEYLILTEKEAIANLAKSKLPPDTTDDRVNNWLGLKVSSGVVQRNLESPSLLQTYCNMAELIRIRQEIILAATECQILTQIYQNQCLQIGEKDIKVLLETDIQYEKLDADPSFVDFFQDGPSHQNKIDLAVKEFDSALLSNFNFRNPDTFKINIMTSGLEEVRAILYYQVMQKQLLIVATRTNAILLDSYEKAISELQLIRKVKYCIPNSIVNYTKVTNRGSDNVNLNYVESLSRQYKSNMSSACKTVFFNVQYKKNQSRSTITKDFQTYLATCTQQYPHNNYCVSRVMRSFRVKQLLKFVTHTLQDVHYEAQKIQALQVCQRLRKFNRMFKFDLSILGIHDHQASLDVFKYETSLLLENFPNNYLPKQFMEEVAQKASDDYFCIRDHTILDHTGIPSSMTLIQLEACTTDDLKAMKQRKLQIKSKTYPSYDDNEDIKEYQPDHKEPESHIKRMLPTFTYDLSVESLIDLGKRSDEVAQQIQKRKGKSGGTVLDYEEAVYFGDTSYAQLTNYWFCVEKVITMEWFIRQLNFKSNEAVSFDHAIESGLNYFNVDEFDQRVKANQKVPEIDYESAAQAYCQSKITRLRSKQIVAEQIQSLSNVMKSFIAQFRKTKVEQRGQFLISYTEFRYQQIISTMHQLIEHFYQKNRITTVQSIQHALATTTRMEHQRLVHLRPSNYSVSCAAVRPQHTNLESNQFISKVTVDDMINFNRTVQPILNEKCLEPSQINLMQSMFQQDYQKNINPSQFAGQMASCAFKALNTALLQLNYEERIESLKFLHMQKIQANDFMMSVYDDDSLNLKSQDQVYNLEQLSQAKKFINEFATAKLLKTALMCWINNSALPSSKQEFLEFEEVLRQQIGWKQVEQKEEIVRKLSLNNSFGTTTPTSKDLKDLKAKIELLVNDQTLATAQAIKNRDLLVKALKEEFSVIKKKVILDQYFNMKADITIYANEIEKLLIRASIRTLDAESAALTKCFTLNVPSIQYHIHPFQQFAATFFDHVDPNLNLDMSNKVNAVQELLTKTRNRSTEVETLTSGPGIVITIKDLNEILIDFSRSTIQDHQKQFKARSEKFAIVEQHLKQLLYLKDRKIENMENRIRNIGQNLECIISAKISEKGNQLVYELDSSNRILSIYKQNIGQLEKTLTDKIQNEQFEKFKRQSNLVLMKNQKFYDYKQAIVNLVGADFAEDQDRIKAILKEKADEAKIEDLDYIPNKSPMYPANGTSKNVVGGIKSLAGCVVPNGFKHYTYCTCYVPNPKYPRPTLELAELDMLSEHEARSELARMCVLVQKQRLLYRTKEMCLKTKYQNQINLMKGQQNNNAMLWTQLEQTEKRDQVLKDQLLITQEQLSKAEKTIESLNYEIKALDAERCRLYKFKTQKQDRLKDLESKVKKIETFDNIDGDKLVAALTQKDDLVKSLQSSQQVIDEQLLSIQKRNMKEIERYKKLIFKEQVKNTVIFDKMEQINLELKMLDQNDSSVSSIWKKKCIDMWDVCKALKQENSDLRERCTELINQGLMLTDNIATQNNNEINESSQSQSKFQGISLRVLPTLLPDLHQTPAFDNRNVTPSSRYIDSQPSRNARHNSTHFQSMSKQISSMESHVPTDGVLHSVKWQPSPINKRYQSNDIRSILTDQRLASEMQIKREKKNKQLQMAQNNVKVTSLNQDSLFTPKISTFQKHEETNAIQKLKGASRFSKQEVRGVSYNQLLTQSATIQPPLAMD